MRYLLPALLVFSFGCTKTGTPVSVWPSQPGPKVVASFPPIACFVKNVMGDRGGLRGVMSSQGPHEFSPMAKDAETIAGANLFFINGIELDTNIAKTMQKGSTNKELKLVSLGDKLDDKLLLEGECHHDHKDGNHHHETGFDAHLWLGPDIAMLFVASIAEELKAADPEHAIEYDRRAKEYTAKLKRLLDEGQASLKTKSNRKIITMHESMGYFARAFGVEVVGSIQASPGQEPNRKKLDEVIKACIDHKVTVLAVEPQYLSTNAVQAIQREIKAKGLPELTVIELDSLETNSEAVPAADWYERKIQANIDALSKALK